MIKYPIQIAGALSCAVATLMGAFAAHALPARVSAEALQSIETANRFLFFHGLALLIVPAIGVENNAVKKICYTMLWGILAFSGSIYLFSLPGISSLQLSRVLWPITPIGGLLLISAWIWLAYCLKPKP